MKLMSCIKDTLYEEVWPFWGLERHKGHVVDMHNSWANINDHLAWNMPHLHNGCWYSGVFYIQADGDEGQLQMIETDTKVVADFPHNPRDRQNWTLRPTTGTLFLFPSALMHMVEPNSTNKDRYSISFNMGYKFKGDNKVEEIEGFRWDETLFDITLDGKLVQVSTLEQ